jgi:hypothetical protein
MPPTFHHLPQKVKPVLITERNDELENARDERRIGDSCQFTLCIGAYSQPSFVKSVDNNCPRARSVAAAAYTRKKSHHQNPGTDREFRHPWDEKFKRSISRQMMVMFLGLTLYGLALAYSAL